MTADDLGYQIGLLSGIRTTTSLRLTNRLHTITPRRLPRLSGIVAGGLAAAPLAAMEHAVHGRRIARHHIDEPPVFIIGHWRSGTTHLHNLLSQDPDFGSVSMFQALAPDYSLLTRSWLKPLFERLVPSKRPMDNMEWPMDAPQEEEIPLAKLTPYSWYLQFLFPEQAVETFERSVLLSGAPSGAERELETKLLRLYRIASLNAEGRRLLLKNPVHTARIPLLLKLFPDARFVYIHRSPYDVFASTVNLHRRILNLTALQRYDQAAIEENVLTIYSLLIDRYLQDRAQVPEGRLVEVSFAELDRDPVGVVSRLYGSLDLGSFEAMAPTLKGYVGSLDGYRKNEFPPLDAAQIEAINRRWSSAFAEWGYDRVTPRPRTLDSAV